MPAIVVDANSDAKQIVTMLAENTQRVGLSVTEEAAAFEQLRLLDWTPEQIATMAAQPPERVKQALVLNRLPEAARRAADDGELTLEFAARLEQFADDPKTLARIVARGRTSSWGYRHAIAEETTKRQRAEARERLRAELVLEGVKVISRPKDFPYNSQAAAASQLVDKHGQTLDPDKVRTQSGFAAFIESTGVGGDVRAVVVCTDPEGWGYTRTGFVSAANRARRAAEQQAIEAWRDALGVAASVRHEFYRQRYTNPKMARAMFASALRFAVANPDNLAGDCDLDELLVSLAGARKDTIANAGEDRLRRFLVARWVVAHETMLHHAALGWPIDSHATAAWLDQLVTDGFTLSDAETRLREDLSHQPSRLTDQDDEEQDQEEEDEEEERDQDDKEDGERGCAGPGDEVDPTSGEPASDDTVRVLAGVA